MNVRASHGLNGKLLICDTVLPGREEGRVANEEGGEVEDKGRERQCSNVKGGGPSEYKPSVEVRGSKEVVSFRFSKGTERE